MTMMGQDDSEQNDAKRQRINDAVDQQTAFQEDMARIRASMIFGNGARAQSSAAHLGVGVGVGNSEADVRRGDARPLAEDDGERSGIIPERYPAGNCGSGACPSGLAQLQQRGGEALLQQQQSSGGPTVQQQTVLGHHIISQQQQQVRQSHAPNIMMGGGQRSVGVLDGSDEEDGSDNWLQNYSTHHTRVGPKYQVVDLPTASSHDPRLAGSHSCVSPGSIGGK